MKESKPHEEVTAGVLADSWPQPRSHFNRPDVWVTELSEGSWLPANSWVFPVMNSECREELSPLSLAPTRELEEHRCCYFRPQASGMLGSSALNNSQSKTCSLIFLLRKYLVVHSFTQTFVPLISLKTFVYKNYCWMHAEIRLSFYFSQNDLMWRDNNFDSLFPDPFTFLLWLQMLLGLILVICVPLWFVFLVEFYSFVWILSICQSNLKSQKNLTSHI